MPEVVADYAENKDILALGRIYNTLLSGYQDDTEKYTPTDSMRHILRRIVDIKFHLCRHIGKFIR